MTECNGTPGLTAGGCPHTEKKMLIDLAKKARLRVNDVAWLMGVRRDAASRWFNGHATPHRVLRERQQKVVDAIAAAMENGSLPVPRDTHRLEHGAYVRKVFRDFMGDAAE